MSGTDTCKGCLQRDELIARQDVLIAKLEARMDRLEVRLERAEAENTKLRKENRQLRKENRKLRARVERLETQLNRNSNNSSRPPSTDPPDVREKRPSPPPSDRKPGGQPGHEGHTRELLPSSEVDEQIHVYPKRCQGCKRTFKSRDQKRRTLKKVRRHQRTEIPEPRPYTTEWQMHALACGCGAVTWAEWPANVPAERFGPRVQAVLAMLTGRFRASRREAQAMMQDLFGVFMALGQVSAIEKKVSQALAQPVKEAQEYAQAQRVAGADETSWPQGKRRGSRKAWLWVMTTSLVTVCMVLRRRSTEAAKKLLGTFSGILVTDRWCAYLFHGIRKRQLCWSHLKRDFQEFAERRDAASRMIGQALLHERHRMFAWWHRVRDGTLSRSSFQAYMKDVRVQVRRLLRQGSRCRNRLTAATCRDLLKLFPALWTFVRVPGVEPTNNGSERAVRPAVLWRKGCFGSRSQAGGRFVGRMLTVAATLKQQGRNLLDYMTRTLDAFQRGKPGLSLLPQPRRLAQLKATA